MIKVHPSSYVDEGARIGEGTVIWHFCHIQSTAVIGRDCSLGQNVNVAGTVGDRCRIQNNVSVYQGVTLEDGVFCGPSCVFTNVSIPRAEHSVHGHYAPTLIRRGASLGANSTVVCGHTVGRWAMIAAGAVVTRDVPDFALMAGVPARQIGWVDREGNRVPDCPETLSDERGEPSVPDPPSPPAPDLPPPSAPDSTPPPWPSVSTCTD